MAEVVSKQIRNCFKLELFDDDHIIDAVSVRVSHEYMQENNYAAIQLAASSLLEDVATFEPPLEDASEEDIAITVGPDYVIASIDRHDAHTVSAPGYTFLNYPARQEIA
jgi:hypothetical protein